MAQHLFFVLASLCVRDFFVVSHNSCMFASLPLSPRFFACDSTMHLHITAFSISNWNLSWHYLNSNLIEASNGKLSRSLCSTFPFYSTEIFYSKHTNRNHERTRKWQITFEIKHQMRIYGMKCSNKIYFMYCKLQHSCAFWYSK